MAQASFSTGSRSHLLNDLGRATQAGVPDRHRLKAPTLGEICGKCGGAVKVAALAHLRAWINRVAQRPTVARGRDVPKSIPSSEMKQAGEKMIMR